MVVVGFPQVLEPVRHGWKVASGQAHAGWWGDALGTPTNLLAGGQAYTLGHKEYSMVAHPSSPPLHNNDMLSLLWVWTFSWVPSVVAFHSLALIISFPLPTVHCFLFP